MYATNDRLLIGGLMTWCDGYDFNSIASYPLSNCNASQRVTTIKKDARILQNYPNPFNPTTMIKYSVGTRNLVTIKIYDVIGKEVVTLVNEVKEAGIYNTQFDGSNLASGTYFYKISVGDVTNVKKMILIK